MDRILLTNSFGFFPNFPSVSTAKIKAALVREGAEIHNLDLNLLLWKALLDPEFLERLEYREDRFAATAIPFPLGINAKTHELVKDNVLGNIGEALGVFRSKTDFYRHDRMVWAVNILFQAQQLIHCHYGCFITNKVIFWPEMGFNVNDLDAIEALSRDSDRNPFVGLFDTVLRPVVEARNPEVVGIDVAFPWEILPTLTMSRRLKEEFPDIHLNFTGHGFDEMNFSRVAHRMKGNPRLFFGFDSIFLARNDADLVRFYAGDVRQVDVEAFESLAVADQDGIRMSSRVVERIDETFDVPDYSDLDFAEYFTPSIVLIDKMSNKCFWSKCAFCNINAFKKETHKVPVGKFHERLRAYHERYGARHFFLLDEAIDAQYVTTLCDLLLASGDEFVWSIRTRIDADFTDDLLAKMKRAGCREMWIGMENASPPLLKAMNKCGDPEEYVRQAERIVEACGDVGIGLHFCLLFGFPLETQEDRMANLAFFRRIRKHLRKMPFFVTFNIFNLNYGSGVHRDPERFGVSWIDESERNFNMINIPYRTTNGNDLSNPEYEKAVDDLATELCDVFVPSKQNQLLWFVMGDSPWELLYKEHYAKVGRNPYQDGGGFLERLLVKGYLHLEKKPWALRHLNRFMNKAATGKATVYR